MSETFIETMLIAGTVLLVLFFLGVYIIRAVFNIPGIIRLHKAQVRLLEHMAKKQGVEEDTVQTIISETHWDTLN